MLFEQHFLSPKEPELRKDFFRVSQRKRADKRVLLVGLMLVLLAAMLRTAYEGAGLRWVTRSLTNCFNLILSQET